MFCFQSQEGGAVERHQNRVDQAARQWEAMTLVERDQVMLFDAVMDPRKVGLVAAATGRALTSEPGANGCGRLPVS